MNLFTLILVIAGIALVFAGLYWWFRANRAIEQAKARAAARAAWLNRELELTDSQIQAVAIWVDEQIERNDRQIANAILEKVGTELSADESVEAKRLLAFLVKIRHTDANGELKTSRDIGLAWFACLQLEDKDPASQLVQLFKVLNDAWTATREGQAPISVHDQEAMLGAIGSTVLQSRIQS